MSVGMRVCKAIASIAVLLLFIFSVLPLTLSAQEVQASLSSMESSLLDAVDGHRLNSRDLELENMTLSFQAYRSAGSSGANATADWILDQFAESGLEAWKESFEFRSWDIRSNSSLVIDEDGNPSTNDLIEMRTFRPEQWSWSTTESGVDGNAVLLPLPQATSRAQIGWSPIDANSWNSIDTVGKVVFVGREVRWDSGWQEAFMEKITSQKPAAVVFIWWYDWMKEIDTSFYSSSGGLPLGPLGPYFWQSHIPVGHLNFSESTYVKSLLPSHPSRTFIKIDSFDWLGTHHNILGRINGTQQNSMIVIGAHYDSVLDPGFGDNGGGLAALIELAKVLGEARDSGTYIPSCSILFVGFAAEELGMVGSAEFVKAHSNEMKTIKAVINLDCIGSERLRVSTDHSSLGLKDVVLRAASDLEVEAASVEEESSDHQSFASPSSVNQQISWSWEVDLGIDSVTPVQASVSMLSSPLTYNDLFLEIEPGWIHTDKDRSGVKGWIEVGNLSNHTKVALLSILYLDEELGGKSSSAPLELLLAGFCVIVALVALAIVLRKRRTA